MTQGNHTVAVKKADGTIEHVPLDQVRGNESAAAAPTSNASAGSSDFSALFKDEADSSSSVSNSNKDDFMSLFKEDADSDAELSNQLSDTLLTKPGIDETEDVKELSTPPQPQVSIPQAPPAPVNLPPPPVPSVPAAGTSTLAPPASPPSMPTPPPIPKAVVNIDAPAKKNMSAPPVMPPSFPTPQRSTSSWGRDDLKSPIETAESEMKGASHVVAGEEVHAKLEAVLNMLDIQISPDHVGRLESLITSRIKGVRDDSQLLEYLKLESDKGGCGLSEEDSNKVLVALKRMYHLDEEAASVSVEPPKAPPMPSPSPVANKPKPEGLVSIGSAMPKPVPPPKEENMPKTSVGKPVISDILPQTSKDVPHSPDSSMNSSISSLGELPAFKHTMGPVEEVGNFSLEHLRRYRDTQEAVEEMKRRINTLKGESYITYLDARFAWYISPIYRMYQDILVKAINSGRILDEMIGESELSPEEVDRIVALNSLFS